MGNVTSATLTTVRASLSGNTLSIGTGPDEGVDNFTNGFDAFNDFAASGLNGTKDITAVTNGFSNGFSTNYSYLAYGEWSECTSCGTANEVGVTGGFVYGLATDPAAIPTIGTASYVGEVNGQYVDAAGLNSRTFADLNSTADFSARTLSFTTTNSFINSTSSPSLNMSGNLSYSAGSNQFSGPVTSTGLSGTATGKFLGPAAQEIGGVYTLRGTAGGHDGVFAGK